MDNCPFNQCCDDDCKQCTDTDKAKKIECVAEVLQPIIANIFECLTPVIKECTRNIIGLWHSVIECYPDKRVVHLAIRHKKSRVRKKNINRIMKWINTTHTKMEDD